MAETPLLGSVREALSARPEGTRPEGYVQGKQEDAPSWTYAPKGAEGPSRAFIPRRSLKGVAKKACRRLLIKRCPIGNLCELNVRYSLQNFQGSAYVVEPFLSASVQLFHHQSNWIWHSPAAIADKLDKMELSMTPADTAAAVAEAIVAHEGTKAWMHLRGEPTPEDLQEQTITTLQQIIQDTAFNTRLGQALSYHINAKRQIDYYHNDPTNREASLHDAELESGHAMAELEQLGLRTLQVWLIASELHMSVLQEWLNKTEHAGEQENINLHYNYIVNHHTAMRQLFLHDYNYSVVEPHTNGNASDFPEYRAPERPIIAGQLAISLPEDETMDTLSAVYSGDYVIRKLKSITS